MNSLTSTFKPFVVLMKLFGLPLDNDGRIYKCLSSRWILSIYCALSSILNLAITGVMTGLTIECRWTIIVELARNLQFKTPYWRELCRLLLSNLAQVLSCHLVLSGVPTIFVIHVYATRSWKNLWINFLKIQEDMKLSRDFNRKCKTRCYFSLILLILVCYGYILIVSFNHHWHPWNLNVNQFSDVFWVHWFRVQVLLFF